jgi:hypothetical protein
MSEVEEHVEASNDSHNKQATLPIQAPGGVPAARLVPHHVVHLVLVLVGQESELRHVILVLLQFDMTLYASKQ